MDGVFFALGVFGFCLTYVYIFDLSQRYREHQQSELIARLDAAQTLAVREMSRDIEEEQARKILGEEYFA